jgi:5'-deoxynucleotidase YfbR-like HD superfamily hydrolase
MADMNVGRIEFAPSIVPSSIPSADFTGTLSLDIEDLRKVVAETSLKDLLESVSSFANGKTGHDRVGSHSYTHTGRLMFPCDPRPEEVFIRDIAAGLSSSFRFLGATKQRMTVAEHCYIASYIGPKETALERLLHDAPEAYIGDLIRPIKVIPIFGDLYLRIEDGLMKAIATRYGLQYPFPADVRAADETLLKAEITQNIESKAHALWNDESVVTSDQVKLFYWRPELAEAHFLDRFRELAKERDISWETA